MRILIIAGVALITSTGTHSQTLHGTLENPVAGSIESGVGLVSGWHCTAQKITVFINGVDLGESGVGSIRNDTRSICGHANTGFSLLYNYNILEPGEHLIQVYADGHLLDQREFSSVRSGGQPYLAGANRTVEVEDFPTAGTRATLTWSQAKQSFVVTSVDDATQDPPSERVSASNARLSCWNENRFMDQVLTTFTLHNPTGYTLSKIDMRMRFSSPSLLIPVEYVAYYAPAGGIVGPNSTSVLQLLPNAYSDFTQAAYPHCAQLGGVLEVEILKAYDANGNEIHM